MNERFKELAEQAGWTDGYYASDDGPWVDPEFNKEKFAELIVKNCLKFVDVGRDKNEIKDLIKSCFEVDE